MTMYTATWCPELNVYRVSNGKAERVMTEAELREFPAMAELCRLARAAVEEGRAVAGVHVEAP